MAIQDKGQQKNGKDQTSKKQHNDQTSTMNINNKVKRNNKYGWYKQGDAK